MASMARRHRHWLCSYRLAAGRLCTGTGAVRHAALRLAVHPGCLDDQAHPSAHLAQGLRVRPAASLKARRLAETRRGRMVDALLLPPPPHLLRSPFLVASPPFSCARGSCHGCVGCRPVRERRFAASCRRYHAFVMPRGGRDLAVVDTGPDTSRSPPYAPRRPHANRAPWPRCGSPCARVYNHRRILYSRRSVRRSPQSNCGSSAGAGLPCCWWRLPPFQGTLGDHALPLSCFGPLPICTFAARRCTGRRRRFACYPCGSPLAHGHPAGVAVHHRSHSLCPHTDSVASLVWAGPHTAPANDGRSAHRRRLHREGGCTASVFQ
mmetsp:Transcript_13559/g.41180  ORF Transcript_13559/g.41180 Transcript_13559/m.41180 type:complete len:322 (-) Transcript_13559:614-1579(-)